MAREEKKYPGAFRAGDSYLHLLDPRFKLLLLSFLMASIFSANDGWRLGFLFILWSVAACYCNNGWRDGLKIFRFMRWLLLFTFLLHLLFTPGRTLFGTTWLSYDGLLRGLLIDSQLLLAVLFSMLLAWTTNPERLIWGLTSLLSPLQKLKLPVQEIGGLLVLVMQFLPVIRDEAVKIKQQTRVPAGWLLKLKANASLVVPLLMNLVGRADQLAIELASIENPEPQIVSDRRLTQFDWVFFVLGCFVLILLRMV